jgi:hypothetical protein
MSEQFDIIFRGDIVFGHQLADVKVRLQQLFKADAAKIDALFTGRPVPLKRNLDLESANKYRDALIKAGAQVELSATVGAQSDVLSKQSNGSQSAQQRPSASPPVQQAEVTVWTLAPVGSSLLAPTEKTNFVPRNIDTSALTLKPEGGNLIEASEKQTEEIAPVFVPDFDIAEVGADLITAEEKMDLPFVEIELEDWTIAEAGADLISDSEKTISPTPVIHVPDVGLAPAGSDLGQLKPVIKPVTPDISGIRLTD